jgi:hypothetical protein
VALGPRQERLHQPCEALPRGTLGNLKFQICTKQELVLEFIHLMALAYYIMPEAVRQGVWNRNEAQICVPNVNPGAALLELIQTGKS